VNPGKVVRKRISPGGATDDSPRFAYARAIPGNEIGSVHAGFIAMERQASI
jgi:hypothetical protein